MAMKDELSDLSWEQLKQQHLSKKEQFETAATMGIPLEELNEMLRELQALQAELNKRQA